MSKKLSITLLVLVAFFVLGLSISANAAKPPSEQLIVSAPIYASGFICNASNLTDTELNVTFTFFHETYNPESRSRLIPAGGALYALADAPSPPGFTPTYCVVEWVGMPGDVTASICGFFDSDLRNTISCLELH